MDSNTLTQLLTTLGDEGSKGYTEGGLAEIGAHILRFEANDVANALPAVLLSVLRSLGTSHFDYSELSQLLSLLNVGSFDGNSDLDGNRLFGDKLRVRSRMTAFSEVSGQLSSAIVAWLQAIGERVELDDDAEEDCMQAIRYWTVRQLNSQT